MFSLMVIEKVSLLFFVTVAYFYLARILSPADFSAINIYQAILTVAGIFLLGSVDPGIIKKMALSNPEEAQKATVTHICLRLLMFPVVISGSWLWGQVYGYNSSSILIFSLLGFGVLLNAVSLIDSYFIICADVKNLVLVRMAMVFIVNILKWIFVLKKQGNITQLEGVAILSIDYVVVVLASLIFFAGRVEKFTLAKSDILSAIKTIAEEKALLFSSFVSMVNSRLLLLIMGFSATFENISLYAIVMKIIDATNVFTTIAINLNYPALAVSKKTNGFDKASENFFFIGNYSGIFSGVICYVAGALLVYYLGYGDKYPDLKRALVILPLAIFANVSYIFSGRWCIASGNSNMVLIRNIISFFLTVSFGVYVTEKFGGIGAIYLCTFIWFITGVLINIFNQPTRECFHYQLKGFVWKQW
jgi:O-antigen/teichoic acid export membrane protein